MLAACAQGAREEQRGGDPNVAAGWHEGQKLAEGFGHFAGVCVVNMA